ncbi:uncharacterized protein TRIVIDRAFT_204941 [Trichoderma virens Gv29-8]|uniref:Uncharacterized protein n=1 Tax=Hypocrea virens (strain Gv29-8 / FGSC 10586) TaxID=413071 RepID=G9N5G5_HYPVG|nr:uncharacterized protein TRIVIDRAFT_204941 [Trichoderma virens Gv29-8]EHK18010.1 hypothetical protein TRIVIDRAFT_204941 [Trichoderma virens Gv29-8]UKZ54129.1 hypothetical protein TrVGV298_007935 [Trichoderma virens]
MTSGPPSNESMSTPITIYKKLTSTSFKPPCRNSPGPLGAQAQGQLISRTGNSQRGNFQPPSWSGHNGPSPKWSFALEQWLKESRRDGPFNAVASAKPGSPGSDQADSAAPALSGRVSVKRYAGTSAGLLDADKAPGL